MRSIGRRKDRVAGGVLLLALVLLALVLLGLAFGRRVLDRDAAVPAASASPDPPPASAAAEGEAAQGFLSGRVPTLAEPPAPWRRLEALEQFVVLTCAGDRSLSWIVRSREEERKLFTPKFYETCRSGTLRQLVWPCCDEDGVQVISSRARLEEVLAAKTRDPSAPPGPAPRWREAYLADVARAIPSFEKETLVLLTVPYGGTGMAKAFLDFTESEGVLTARVRIELPPPPLTPDTAVFRFAFAVDTSRIRELELVTVPPFGAKHGPRRIPLRDGVRS
jgi:hypothetical protein